MLQKEDLLHQPDQIVPDTHNWSQSLTIILTSVLLLAIVGTGGYLIVHNQPILRSQLPTPSITPRDKWELYTNKVYDFSFQYPSRFKPYMEEHSWGVIVGCGCEGFQWFDVEVVPSVLEPSAWWRAHGKSMFNGNIGINGKFHPEAYESTGSSKLLQGQYVYEVNAKTNRKSISTLKPSLKPWETSDGQFLVLIIPSNGNLIIITLYEDEPKLFAKILSTFNYK